MATIIQFFAIYGLTFTIKQSSLFHRPRLWLLSLHPLFGELLDCWFCTGNYSGYMIYLATHLTSLNLIDFLLWGLAGATFSYLLENLISFLQTRTD